MKEITVMVADASHEKYIDTILTTIEEAAKVRGTGIAKRSHEYLATKMREAKAVIALSGDRFAGFSYIETWGNKQYVTTRLSRTGHCPSHQRPHFHTGTHPLATRQDFLAHQRSSRDGDEHTAGLSAGHLRRPHRRRGFLARLRRLHQLRCAPAHQPSLLHLHRYALRSRRTLACQNSRRRAAAHQKHRRKAIRLQFDGAISHVPTRWSIALKRQEQPLRATEALRWFCKLIEFVK